MFGESFSSFARKKERVWLQAALITVEIVFIIDNSKRRHKTEGKFAIHEIQQLFCRLSSFFFEEIPISIIGEKKEFE